MTGRRDSTVAAFLLKKQGFECIGISLLFSDESFLQKQVNLIETKQKEVNEEDLAHGQNSQLKSIPKEKLYSRCHIQDVEEVAKIAQALDIPFYAVKSQAQFKAGVTDPLIGSKLAGKSFQSCLSCNNIKLQILLEKADELGCDYIATGHYAKIVENQQSGYINVHAANDLEHDQSLLLSKLPQSALKRLILPLSETRLEEVVKVEKMLGLSLLASSDSKKICFNNDPRLPLLVEVAASDNLLRKGHLYLQSENMVNGEHSGIHNYHVGQQKLKMAGEKSGDSGLTVSELNPSNGTVLVTPLKDLFFDRLFLENVMIDPKFDRSKPLSGFAKLGTKGELFPCQIQFKSFSKVIIKFTKVYQGVVAAGLSVSIYNKEGISGKIILSGDTKKCGVVVDYKFTNYISSSPEDMDDEEEENNEPSLPENFH